MGPARRSNHSEFQPRFIITFRAGFLLGIQASCPEGSSHEGVTFSRHIFEDYQSTSPGVLIKLRVDRTWTR